MKLAEKVLDKLKDVTEAKVNIEAIADQLTNNEEAGVDDLVDVSGLKKNQAKKLLDAWFKVDAKERNALGFNEKELLKWIKGII